MNPYSTELRRAMTLADQILALKQNRSLSETDAMQVDAGAFFPTISLWTRLCGFRMSGPPEAGQALLQKAACRPPERCRFGVRVPHGSRQCSRLLRQQHRQCSIVPVAFARVRDQTAGVLVQRRLPLFGAVPGQLYR